MKHELRTGPSENLKAALKIRRQRLFDLMANSTSNSMCVLSGAPQSGGYAVYGPDQSMVYLSGCAEPSSVAVFICSGSERTSLLFKRERDLHEELWNGPMLSVEDGKGQLGFDLVFPLEKIKEELGKHLRKTQLLFFEPTGEKDAMDLVNQAIATSKARRYGLEIRESRHMLASLRMIKDSLEVSCLQRAGDLSSRGHEAAMRVVRPGLNESEVQAELEYVFKREGGQGLGYSSIVASGSNSCCLHYNLNSCEIKNGDLLLIDAGAYYEGYTADITRTFPANGVFTAAQALIYDIVLEVQEACIARVKPGESHHEMQNFAVRQMLEKLHQARVLLDISVDECIEKEDYKRFYPHNLGHWLGRDVHDVGPSYQNGKPVPFAPGNVITVEPGLYFQTYDTRIPEAFRGIGVRIEDDILVTETGSHNFTSVLKKRHEIEAYMKSHSKG